MHTLAKALINSKDITLFNFPNNNEYPEVWVVTHNLAYISNGSEFLICRGKYKSEPDNSIIIGHYDEWNEIAKHIYMLLVNKDTDAICNNLDEDDIVEKASEYIENKTFFIDLINEAVDVDDKKHSILLTNYIDDNETLEMFGEVVYACIEDFFENKD